MVLQSSPRAGCYISISYMCFIIQFMPLIIIHVCTSTHADDGVGCLIDCNCKGSKSIMFYIRLFVTGASKKVLLSMTLFSKRKSRTMWTSAFNSSYSALQNDHGGARRDCDENVEPEADHANLHMLHVERSCCTTTAAAGTRTSCGTSASCRGRAGNDASTRSAGLCHK